MKKRVSAFVLAVGMAAAPLAAKTTTNSQSAKSQTTGADQGKLQNRVANAFKRLNRKKAEQKYIQELEVEVSKALYSFKADEVSQRSAIAASNKATKVVLAEAMPLVGIDISEEFKQLQGKSKSS